MMIYELKYSDKVIEYDIPKLSKPVKERIKNTIESKLLIDPIRFGKPLRYNLKGCRRLRVGDYRVIYQVTDTQINILVIQHRKDCYMN
jgi:mRNA interferase RelE/StbE